MALLTEPAARALPDPAEALIREAQRRKRRRRAAVVAAMAVAVAGAAGGYAWSGAGGPPPAGTAGRARPPAARPSVRPPAVDTAAFAHQGRLAFVSQGTLWVLDGTVLRRVPTGGLVPSGPSFSPDGRWLAFVASREVTEHYTDRALGTFTRTVSSELWLARGDGADAHPIAHDVHLHSMVGWDPRRDLLAVSVGSSARVPIGLATGVDLVRPTGSARALVEHAHVTSAVWSPDGSALAVSSQERLQGAYRWGAVLATYPIGGERPTVWLRADTTTASFVVPDGWWPRWGIGYTTVGEGAIPGGSGSADGSPFFTIAGPGATPRPLGTTLMSEGAGAPAATSSGWLAFVADVGTSGRTVGEGEEVVVCAPSGSCTAVPHPATTVTLDPAWTPAGRVLAYVRSPATGYLSPWAAPGWYGEHVLLTFDPATGAVRSGPASPGATVPQWSSRGDRLLYVAGDGLWLHRPAGGPAAEVAHPLFDPSLWPSHDGQVAFVQQFAWWSGRLWSGRFSGGGRPGPR